MHERLLIALALASALLLAACGGVGGGSGGGGRASVTPSPTAGSLEGRTFLSTGVQGRALVPGSVVRLAFENGQVSASAGCNSMGGAYRIEGDLLVTGPLMSTEMACDPALMQQDQWLAELLGGATVALDGDTLTLTRNVSRLTLLDREVADPDRPLLGTRWVVDGLIAGGTVSSVPVGVLAALTFQDGRVDVEAGCNRGGGTVTISDTTIDVGPIGLTKLACAPDAMAVEGAVMRTLSGTVTYRIEAGTLALDGGGSGLTLNAAP